jgi:hypothetical protein
MKRKYAVFAVIFVFSLLIGIQTVEVVDANPVPWPSTPNFEKPTIVVETPQNNTVIAYNATDVWLNFTIAKPDSWTIPDLIPIPSVQVESAEAQWDGNHVSLGWYPVGYSAVLCSAKLNLSQTVPGRHSLNVTVLLNSYYRGAAYNGSHVVADYIMSSSGPVYQYPWAISEIVYFTVEQPTPSQSNPTINTGPTLPVGLNPPIVYIILAVVIVILAVAFALFFFL